MMSLPCSRSRPTSTAGCLPLLRPPSTPIVDECASASGRRLGAQGEASRTSRKNCQCSTTLSEKTSSKTSRVRLGSRSKLPFRNATRQNAYPAANPHNLVVRTDEGLDLVVDTLGAPRPFGLRLLRGTVKDRMRRPETRQQLDDEFRITLRFFAQQVELLLPVAARAGSASRTRTRKSPL